MRRILQICSLTIGLITTQIFGLDAVRIGIEQQAIQNAIDNLLDIGGFNQINGDGDYYDIHINSVTLTTQINNQITAELSVHVNDYLYVKHLDYLPDIEVSVSADLGGTMNFTVEQVAFPGDVGFYLQPHINNIDIPDDAIDINNWPDELLNDLFNVKNRLRNEIQNKFPGIFEHPLPYNGVIPNVSGGSQNRPLKGS